MYIKKPQRNLKKFWAIQSQQEINYLNNYWSPNMSTHRNKDPLKTTEHHNVTAAWNLPPNYHYQKECIPPSTLLSKAIIYKLWKLVRWVSYFRTCYKEHWIRLKILDSDHVMHRMPKIDLPLCLNFSTHPASITEILSNRKLFKRVSYKNTIK